MARPKGSGGNGGLTQADLVREALGELGAGAKPQAIQNHIKEKHNKELSKSLISNYKSTLKKKGGLGGGAGGGRGRGRPAGGAGLRVEHFEQVRELVRQIGADQVKRLADVVG
jgi:hypothetical protein